MNNQDKNDLVQNGTGEMSVREVVLTLASWRRHLLKNWMVLIVSLLVGVGAGVTYSVLKKKLYKAEATFVLDEDSKKSALGGLAMIGLDVGESNAGLFDAADNIIWLYSTRLMLERTLLSQVDTGGKKVLLINWFLEESGIRKKLAKDKVFSQKAKFDLGVTKDSLSVEQNAVISWCVGSIKTKYLNVYENKKTQNIIVVEFKSEDELFSKLFTETLVKKVNDYYILTKTKRVTDEINLLSLKADSAKAAMNSSMYQAALATDLEPYANPNRVVLRVPPQRKRVDVDVQSAIYTELMKNLESRRMVLAQEMPLIQVIDSPILPLEIVKPSPVKMGIIAGIVFFILGCLLVMMKFWYRNVMRQA